jgi:hypothetical protein
VPGHGRIGSRQGPFAIFGQPFATFRYRFATFEDSFATFGEPFATSVCHFFASGKQACVSQVNVVKLVLADSRSPFATLPLSRGSNGDATAYAEMARSKGHEGMSEGIEDGRPPGLGQNS